MNKYKIKEFFNTKGINFVVPQYEDDKLVASYSYGINLNFKITITDKHFIYETITKTFKLDIDVITFKFLKSFYKHNMLHIEEWKLHNNFL